MKRHRHVLHHHLCSFSSGLDSMKRRDQKYPERVLRVLREVKCFSVFEATENATIAKTMTYLVSSGLIEVEPLGYPWANVKLTAKGEKYAQVA